MGKHSTKANTARGKGTSMQVKELNYQLMVLAPRMNLMFTKASTDDLSPQLQKTGNEKHNSPSLTSKHLNQWLDAQ